MADWEPNDGTPREPVSRDHRISKLLWLWLIAAPACFVETAEPAQPAPTGSPGPARNATAPQPEPQEADAPGEPGPGEVSTVVESPAVEAQNPEETPAPRSPDAAALIATDVESHVVKKWGGFLSLIPFQTWPELGAHAVGLLMASGQQPWGGSINWTRGLEHGTSRVEYRFLFDRSSPYAVYFVSDGRGYNFMRGWSVPTPSGQPARHQGVAMFRPDTPNDYGLGKKAHLVDVEVNGGRGGKGIHFVITKLRVLDGSKAYPLQPDGILVGLRNRFDATLASNRGRTKAILAKARASNPKDWKLAGRPDPQIAVWPTWIEKESVLEVVFIARASEAAQGPPIETMRQCPKCPCTPDGRCAPCARCDPRPIVEHPSRQYGWEIAAKYRVDRRGRLVSETLYTPRAF